MAKETGAFLRKVADFGHKPPVIFGTTWERDTAKELKGNVVEVGFLASYEVVLLKKIDELKLGWDSSARKCSNRISLFKVTIKYTY